MNKHFQQKHILRASNDMINEFNTNTAPEILQLNMEIISKELNDLVVGGEQEYEVIQQFSQETIETTSQAFMSTPEVANNFQIPTYITNTFYGQQRYYGEHGLQNVPSNIRCYPAFQKPVPSYGGVNNNFHNMVGNPSHLCTGKYFSPHVLPSKSIYSNASMSPSYEFHYLRSHGENGKKLSGSMSTLCGQGAYRKIAKSTQKHFNYRGQNSTAENGTLFDLSTLDIINNDKENFAVRHLFDLLRDLHCAVSETPPSFEPDPNSQFEETFAPSTKKSSMPSTLNVQNQVKQACRKLTIFIYEMGRILNTNKMFDIEMHAECEFHLNQLRQHLNEMEMYRRVVMEHKHGKFLREEVKVQAERLSLLLEQTNRQIREVHIRILAVDWFIGVKYRGDVHVAAMQLNTNNNEELSKKSKIGVINEILQMCNTTDTTPIKTNTLMTATTDTTYTTNTQIATKKPDATTNSPTKLFVNQNVLNVKPLLNKNNDNIFNNYKADQIKRAVTAGGSHTRHPYFYIG